MPAPITVFVSISGLWFAALASHGFALRREKDYRGYWGAMVLSLLPAVGTSFYLAAGNEVSMSTKSIVLGIAGAAIGASVFVWLGHALPMSAASAKGQQGVVGNPSVGNDSTIVGTVPTGGVGDRSTVVNDADQNGNVIHNRTEAIGADAHADPGTVAIGARAGSVEYQAPPVAPAPATVTGATITGNSQGGVAAEIDNAGSPTGAPSTGAEIDATGCPGQSVTGLNVTQTGPGTGLKIVQSGPGIGMRVVAGIGGPNCSH